MLALRFPHQYQYSSKNKQTATTAGKYKTKQKTPNKTPCYSVNSIGLGRFASDQGVSGDHLQLGLSASPLSSSQRVCFNYCFLHVEGTRPVATVPHSFKNR